eukprot:scaffold1350_cov277-Prasinococcus_capsulatus_cf.AAC.1
MGPRVSGAAPCAPAWGCLLALTQRNDNGTIATRPPAPAGLGGGELAGVGDEGDAEGLGVVLLVGEAVDGAHDVVALDDLAEDGVVAVEVRRGRDDDAEVGAVGVGPHVGHGEQPGAVVPQREAARVVLEVAPEHALGVGARLVDEVVDDAVEAVALEVVPPPRALAPRRHHPLLPRAQRAEVLRRPRRVRRVQHEHQPPRVRAVDLDVEEHPAPGRRRRQRQGGGGSRRQPG